MRQTDKEYAGAVFELSAEEEIIDKMLESLRLIKSILKEEADYLEFLSSPAIPTKEKLTALEEAFQGRINEYSLYFLKLLCEKGRIKLIFDIIEEYEELYLEHSGIKRAIITSAVPLSPQQKVSLTDKLEASTGKKIEAEYLLDASLIGGVMIELDSKIYDGTIKGRLRDIKDVIFDEQGLGDQ